MSFRLQISASLTSSVSQNSVHFSTASQNTKKLLKESPRAKILPAFKLQQVCEWPNFLSTPRHTSKSGVTLWKHLGTLTGPSQKTNRFLSSTYTDFTKLLSPCVSIGWTESETIRSPQRWPCLLHCPGGEQSRHQAFPGHYLPHLNTTYCFLRW